MKTKLAAALAMTAAVLVAAPAAHADRASCSRPLETHYSAHYYAVRHHLGARAPGRNIRRYGKRYHLRDGWHVRNARCSELRRSLGQLRRLRSPAPPMLVRVAAAPAQRPAGTLSPSVTAGSTLQAIARCESGGNPATNTGNGFYGKYQFTQSTWQSVGGSGNPAAASEAEQDRRAGMLYAREGPSPWPVCGR
jgi:hypothetical protein